MEAFGVPLGGQGRVGCGRAVCHVLPAGPTCGAGAGREGGREGAAIRSSIVALGCRHNAALRDKVSSAQWGAEGGLGEGEAGSDR